VNAVIVEMGGNEKFCLKWNDYNSAFKDLRSEQDLFDVTLVSDDDEEIEAHRVILSACSPFFKNIFKRRKHQHSLIYIKGSKMTELSAVLDFIYHGEVNIEHEDLEKFLETAADLRIKGLSQDMVDGKVSTVYAALSHSSSNLLQQSQSHSSSNLLQSSGIEAFQSYEEISKVEHVYNDASDVRVNKIETFDELASSSDGHEYQDIPEQEVKHSEMMRYQNGVWLCNVCGKTDRNKFNLKYHTEIHIEGAAHFCSYCGKSYKNKNTLRVHKYRAHASEKIIQQLGHVV